MILQNRHHRTVTPTTFFSLALLTFWFLSGSAWAATPPSFADLAEKLGPTVVNIYTTQTVKARSPHGKQFGPGRELPEQFRRFFGIPDGADPHGQTPEREMKQTSLGSGVIISKDGYIVTNNHVVENADEIKIRLTSLDEYDAKLIGRDPKTDLALIKIDPKNDLPVASFGDSEHLRVGDWVLAIGNPFGLEQTVTAGIVSAKGRTLGTTPYENFIQTDASINPGNSGGPLFDLQGRMVGINTAIYSRGGGNIGIGFAIPVKMAQNVISQAQRTRRCGPWLVGGDDSTGYPGTRLTIQPGSPHRRPGGRGLAGQSRRPGRHQGRRRYHSLSGQRDNPDEYVALNGRPDQGRHQSQSHHYP